MSAEARGAERLRRNSKDYHHAKDVAFVMTTTLTAVRQRLLALPSRLAPYLVGKTQSAGVDYQLIPVTSPSAYSAGTLTPGLISGPVKPSVFNTGRGGV
jgi:hypothetical protein